MILRGAALAEGSRRASCPASAGRRGGNHRLTDNGALMSATVLYRDRRAAVIENADLRVTVLEEGAHIAEIFERRIELQDRAVQIREAVENLAAFDRPIGWTQHVTLGPPFLQKGITEFRASASRSKVYESDFGVADYLRTGAEFTWPNAPRADGGTEDLRRFTDRNASSAYTAHLMDPDRDHAFFVAFSAASRMAFGYVWRRADFPWMGIWEENHSRVAPPWNGRTLTRGMEFGVSPFPETRRQMVDRGSLFDVPTYRWLPAKGRVEAEYWVLTSSADRVPETLEWP